MNVHCVLFGSVPLATWILERMLDCEELSVRGVVCEHRSRSFDYFRMTEPCVYDYAAFHDIPLFELSHLEQIMSEFSVPHLGLSVRYHRILSSDIIDLFDHGIINFHGGELPRFRGVNCANHAILEGCKNTAGTLHYIDTGIDTGDIIDRKYFSIAENDTAHDVFLKTLEALKEIFLRQLKNICDGPLPATPQEDFIDQGESTATYSSGDIDRYRRLSFALDKAEIDRRVRALTFPGHTPAYFEYKGHKLYISAEEPH